MQYGGAGVGSVGSGGGGMMHAANTGSHPVSARETTVRRNYPHLHHHDAAAGVSSTVVRVPYDAEVHSRGRPPSLSGQEQQQHASPAAADVEAPWSV